MTPSLVLAGAAVVLALSVAAPVGEPPIGAVPGDPGPPVSGSYAWPVDGSVIRPFEPPAGPFGAGHRGIDIAAASGTPVRAAERGVVTFAGSLAGDLYVTVEHPDGVRTTSSWLSAVAVRRGDAVVRGQVIGATGRGHPGSAEPPHLHFGARVGDEYIDPMLLLEPRSVAGRVRLAPVEESRGQ